MDNLANVSNTTRSFVDVDASKHGGVVWTGHGQKLSRHAQEFILSQGLVKVKGIPAVLLQGSQNLRKATYLDYPISGVSERHCKDTEYI